MPPQPIRQLRDLTRARTAITRERGREVQRLERLLEDAGIKLSAVPSDILGVSGRAMLEALIAGDRDAAGMAELAKRRLRSKIPELTGALNGRFGEHHAFLARVRLDLIDQHTAAVARLTERIEVVIEPFRGFRTLICSIPGISTLTADVVVAEIGDDMSRFPTAKHLASWAGADPGQQRVGGQGEVQPHPTGQPLPPGWVGCCGDGLRSEPAHLFGRQVPADRFSTRAQKANVAVQRAMLTAIWHMGTTGAL